LTRTVDDARPLAGALRAVGWSPYVVPLTERVAVANAQDRARVARATAWIVTSAAVVPWLPEARPRWVACVGAETARRLEDRGWAPSVVAPRVQELGEQLSRYAGHEVCWPRAEEPTADARPAWKKAGLIVDEVVVYQNREPAEAAAAVRAIWPTDAVMFAAPSAARRLAALVGVQGAVRVVVIGPTTRRAAEEAGWAVFAEAVEPSVFGMVQALGPPPAP
jgi:uroporphyrinogen-III synthase